MGLHTPIETYRTPPPYGVEILDLRHFSSHHLRPLLDRESHIWAQLMAWDYRGSAEMILRYIDSKILPGYAAVKDGRVGGYAFFVYEGNKGVVGDLFADDAMRLQDSDVESRLAAHVIETLQRSPGVQRIEAQLLPHESGVLAGPFVEEGFQRFPRLFMVLPLVLEDAPKPRVIPVPGIEFRRWQEQDFQAVAGLITTSYRGHIDSEINDQYRSLNGSLRFLNNIVRFPGCGIFDPSASFVAVYPPTRAIAGLLLCSRVREDVGHITQICVAPELRGRMIGESLIGLCMQDLRRRNFSALSLTVTEANANAVALYDRIGFETRRRFDAFVWES